MIGLIGMSNCAICEQSKKLLDSNNIEYEFLNISNPDNLKIAQRFNIKVAGKYLYDPDKDKIILVDEYITKVGGNNATNQ